MATKKKILKQLKAIAADMPKIQERNNVLGTTVSGQSLLDAGITETKDGTPIQAEETYKKKSPVVVVVDHVDKMKKMYERYGEGGVQQYLIAVKTFELQNKPKLADVFPDAI